MAAAGLVWFNTKAHNICCFKFYFGILILTKSVAVIPQHCIKRKESNWNARGTRPHPLGENGWKKALNSMRCALTDTSTETRERENWWWGKVCSQMRKWKTEVGNQEYRSRSQVEAGPQWPKSCHSPDWSSEHFSHVPWTDRLLQAQHTWSCPSVLSQALMQPRQKWHSHWAGHCPQAGHTPVVSARLDEQQPYMEKNGKA